MLVLNVYILCGERNKEYKQNYGYIVKTAMFSIFKMHGLL